ncbi:MAG: AraC family transcriptional regulator ligand-binding domain-containing protein [Oceanospirillaceae bacterium]|nr:AraC family transcriptional regulator ligand-binding domain-containing protein [Oceanospirillaceae bacterium]
MFRARVAGVEGLEQLVRELGENPIALMESIGLSQAQFRDPDQYIAYPKLAELMHLCSEACQEPLFGLLLGQRQRLAVLGGLPLISARATTVGEALTIADRYLYLHASGVRLSRVIQADTARLEVTIGIGRPQGLEQLLQISVCQLARFAAMLLDTDPFALPLNLRQAAPQGMSTQGATRFRQLRFGQSFDGVSIPAQALARANHRDDEALNQHLEDYLFRLQTLYPEQLEDQVADVIGRMLPTGEISLDEVAATLNLRPRTLQAQLRDRGSAYRDILRETRLNLARQRLSEPDVSVTELALQLGYSDVAVFSRHFKAWSGLSPRAWRKSKASR